MTPITLLAITTVFYAGYNILVKASGAAVPAGAQTTVLATICIQLAALSTSAVFAGYLWSRGVDNFALNATTLSWAVAAGICIGGAEIAYLYLFGGLNGQEPMSAGVAIPVIVSGTIVIALFASAIVFKESIGLSQIAGALLIAAGIVVMFHDKTGAGSSMGH